VTYVLIDIGRPGGMCLVRGGHGRIVAVLGNPSLIRTCMRRVAVRRAAGGWAMQPSRLCEG